MAEGHGPAGRTASTRLAVTAQVLSSCVVSVGNWAPDGGTIPVRLTCTDPTSFAFSLGQEALRQGVSHTLASGSPSTATTLVAAPRDGALVANVVF
jgi:hypothetical protein